jgi:alkylated DNA nucleotide flippase Atl1
VSVVGATVVPEAEPGARARDDALRPGGDVDEEYTRSTVEVVTAIPPGRVMTYGSVAAAVADRLAAEGGMRRGGPRQCARVLSLLGPSLPWWRVVAVDGRVACRDPDEARRLLVAEGVPLRPDGERVAEDEARWAPEGELAPAEDAGRTSVGVPGPVGASDRSTTSGATAASADVVAGRG